MTVRWAILGSGPVARKFALGLRRAPGAAATLVASRDPAKAEAFARDLGLRAAGSYEAAVRSGEIDAVYIATPPSSHRALALAAIAAGKPVLVEKPFAASADDAEAIAAAARSAGVFCMEAMWTRFLPLVGHLKRLVAEGAVGAPRSFSGSFGAATTPEPGSSLFDPAQGGGALLHRGVYPLSLACHLLGPARELESLATIGPTGVDEDSMLLLRHEGGALSAVQASLSSALPTDCVIQGTAGRIHVAAPIYRPFRLTLVTAPPRGREAPGSVRAEALKEGHALQSAQQRLSGLVGLIRGRRTRSALRPYAGNGYHYQAEELMRCVREGRTESAVMPLDESLALVRLMDRARAAWAAERSGGAGMKVGIIGCGYVFDTYMATWGRHPKLTLQGVADRDPARAEAVSKRYGLRRYADNAELLADPEIDIVVNLTSIDSHAEVTRDALVAGKHVYSEKPLTMDLEVARELVALAAEKGLTLSCAPSNALGDTTQTMWRAVLDGVVGNVRLIYADLDDNPIYLMEPEVWRSPSGAPWPVQHEYEAGCTIEHVGYHLTWLCAIFGPVASVTAFSKFTVPDKTPLPLDPADTPDFSVACLDFCSGVTARVTCSISAPWDHRMRIIGDQGMLSADTYRHYRCPVYLERFTKLSMNARKSYSVRTNSFLQWFFRVGGRRLKLVRNAPPGADGRIVASGGPWWSPRAAIGRLKRSELGQQDKCIGIAELADAVATGRPTFPGADFMLHLTELTLAIQNAGPRGAACVLTTDFAPVAPQPETLAARVDYRAALRVPLLARLADRMIDRLHQH